MESGTHFQVGELSLFRAESLAEDLALTAESLAASLWAHVVAQASEPQNVRPFGFEACAAAIAVVQATLDASSLSEEASSEIKPVVLAGIIDYWRQHGEGDRASQPFNEADLVDRSLKYLRCQEGSPLTSSTAIVDALWKTLGIDRGKAWRTKIAASLLALRMHDAVRRAATGHVLHH